MTHLTETDAIALGERVVSGLITEANASRASTLASLLKHRAWAGARY